MDEILLVGGLIIAFIAFFITFKYPNVSPILSYIAIVVAYWCQYCYVTNKMLVMYLLLTLFLILSAIFVPKYLRKYLDIKPKSELAPMIISFFVLVLMLLSLLSEKYSLLVFNLIAKKTYLVLIMFLVAVIGSANYFLPLLKNNKKRYIISTLATSVSYFMGKGLQFIFAAYVIFYVALDLIIYYR